MMADSLLCHVMVLDRPALGRVMVVVVPCSGFMNKITDETANAYFSWENGLKTMFEAVPRISKLKWRGLFAEDLSTVGINMSS